MVNEQAAFLLDACGLVVYATKLGYTVTGGELARPIEMQQIYVETGRSKTMDSDHIRRCAIDLNFFKDGQLVQDRVTLRPLGDFWEGLNPLNRWGGSWDKFVDVPHFERHVPRR